MAEEFVRKERNRKMDNSKDGFDIVIEPNKSAGDFLRELVSYRELFYFLAWRDILVRYKQTVVGVAWSLLQPFLSMVVFTLVFGRVAKLPNEGVPYPILVFTALLPWQYFSNAMQMSSGSLLSNAHLIGKIYFPRLIVPTSTVIVSTVDFLISLGMLFLLMAWYAFLPSPRIVLLPFFYLLATLAALGAGYWFAALGVKYRDFRHIVPFMIQFGLYVSPVGFSSSIVPGRLRLLYSLNPMAGIIDGFRWCVQGTTVSLYLPGFIISIIISVCLFMSGAWFFRRTERSFADFI
ncbi:MAG: ABC transporter permease [Synergistaceae bacterium]|nr:ABC transporter permease [Synergistaceae bacterium]